GGAALRDRRDRRRIAAVKVTAEWRPPGQFRAGGHEFSGVGQPWHYAQSDPRPGAVSGQGRFCVSQAARGVVAGRLTQGPPPRPPPTPPGGGNPPPPT